jgi:DNA (cytosine-5)-methyltransferase 1
MSINKFRTIDLFAGIGGVRLGFEQTGGFETVYANDCELKCKTTYDLNFKNIPLHVEDIRKIKTQNLPSFDFLLGGFPCQAFSVAGYRHGFNDSKGRGNLFFEIKRILGKKNPEGFLLENVKNLETHDNGNTFKTILEVLATLNYHVTFKVLNSKEYGNIPQTRERLYIVGFKSINKFEKFRFPNEIKLTKSIRDILEPLEKVDSKYYYNDKPLYEKIKNDVVREDTIYQWRRIYVRENKNQVFPTLTANMGSGGHNVPIVRQGKIIRKITPKECARVQGFPDNYMIPSNLSDSHLYHQFGNSVSVPVVNAIAKNIYSALT